MAGSGPERPRAAAQARTGKANPTNGLRLPDNNRASRRLGEGRMHMSISQFTEFGLCREVLWTRTTF